MEYVYELNLPQVHHVFLESFNGFKDDHKTYNYEFRTDVGNIIKPEWRKFHGINWDLILYFKKTDSIGQIHTDVAIDYIAEHGIDNHSHPFGINWVWGGDGIFEYWRYNDVEFTEFTKGADNNKRGAVQLFKEKTTPFATYRLCSDKAYLVYGGLPHRASGISNRRLISLRTTDFNNVPWNTIVDRFSEYIV